MPRLSKIAPDQADPKAREAFEPFIKERGRVPNMFRTAAHRPRRYAPSSKSQITLGFHQCTGLTKSITSPGFGLAAAFPHVFAPTIPAER